MEGEPAHVCMSNYALVVSNHNCVVYYGKYEWLRNAWKVAQSLNGRNYRSIMHVGTYLIILRMYGSAYVWIKKILRIWKLHMLKLNVAVSYTLKCKWTWNVRKRQCMGRNFSSYKFVWITRCKEIVCIGEYYADCSSNVWFSSKITRKVLYACAKFDVKICKYVVFVANILVTYFFSNVPQST